MLIEDPFIGIVSPWLIRGSIEDCISQEKPVIIQDACPGRLLMDTYGNRQWKSIYSTEVRMYSPQLRNMSAVGCVKHDKNMIRNGHQTLLSMIEYLQLQRSVGPSIGCISSIYRQWFIWVNWVMTWLAVNVEFLLREINHNNELSPDDKC